MYEISIQKEFYLLSKKFEYHNYNFMYEITENIFRTVAVAILYFFVSDLRTMIIIVLTFIFSSIFFKFKSPKLKNYSQK